MKRRTVERLKGSGHFLSLNALYTKCIQLKYKCESCLFACFIAGAFQMVSTKTCTLMFFEPIYF